MKRLIKNILDWLSVHAVVSLVTLNVAIFVLVRLLLLCGVPEDRLVSVVSVPSDPAFLLTCPQGPLLYMFTHFNVIHLLCNMLWLWAFGALALRLGTRGGQLFRTYLVAGLAGAAVFIVSGACGLVHNALVGSSAAVLGVVAYLGVTRNMKINLALVGMVNLRAVAAFVIAFMLLMPALEGIWSSVLSHGAGALAGLITGVIEVRRHNSYARTMRTRTVAHNNAMGTNLSVQENAELDELLLAVSKHGYNSLTPEMRSRLFELTRKGRSKQHYQR